MDNERDATPNPAPGMEDAGRVENTDRRNPSTQIPLENFLSKILSPEDVNDPLKLLSKTGVISSAVSSQMALLREISVKDTERESPRAKQLYDELREVGNIFKDTADKIRSGDVGNVSTKDQATFLRSVNAIDDATTGYDKRRKDKKDKEEASETKAREKQEEFNRGAGARKARQNASYGRALLDLSASKELDPEQKKGIDNKLSDLMKGMKDDLKTEFEVLQKLTKEYEEVAANPNSTDQDRLLASKRMNSQAALIDEMSNVLESFSRANANSLSNVIDTITKFVAVFAVGSWATRALIQEPYRFETAPALNVLGNQGELGGVLSSALGTLEGYKVELNQTTAQIGFGAMMAGASWGGPLGLAVAGAGLGASALGLTGFADDLWMAGPGKNEDEILGNQLAMQIANPQRLIQNMTASLPGLLQSGEDNLGYLREGEERELGSTGNVVLDRLLGFERDAEGNMTPKAGGLMSLGYSPDEVGAMYSGATTSLIGDNKSLEASTLLAGQVGRAFGSDPGQALSLMGTAQRYGSRDVGQSLLTTMSSVANEDGKISNFAQAVLVPALMQVIESTAIQNLARSSEDIEESVLSLRANIAGTNTNLGKLMETNPQAFARIYNTLQQATATALDDPAMMAFSLMNGSTFNEIINKDPIVAMRNLEIAALGQGMTYEQMGSKETWENMDGAAVSRLMQGANISRIGDMPMVMQLLQAIGQRGGTTGMFTGMTPTERTAEINRIVEAAGGSGSTGEPGLDDRLTVFLNSDVAPLITSLSVQSASLLGATNSLVGDMKRLQQSITNDVINNTEMMRIVQDSMNRLVSTIINDLGLKKKTSVGENVATALGGGTEAQNAGSSVDSTLRHLRVGYDTVWGKDEDREIATFLERSRLVNQHPSTWGGNSLKQVRDTVGTEHFDRYMDILWPNWKDTTDLSNSSNYEMAPRATSPQKATPTDSASARAGSGNPTRPFANRRGDDENYITVSIRRGLDHGQIRGIVENVVEAEFKAQRIPMV
jgi:hypothetical protein